MASHIIQKAAGQVGGAKRVRSFRPWGAAANCGAAWRIRSIFHDSSMVDRADVLPWSHPNGGDPHCRQSIISPARHTISHIVPSCEPFYDIYVARHLRAMIHHLHWMPCIANSKRSRSIRDVIIPRPLGGTDEMGYP